MEDEERRELDRRTFLKGAGAVLAVGAAPPLLRPGKGPPEWARGAGRGRPDRSVTVTHGVAAGDVSAERALIWCRGSAEGRMQVVFGGDAARVAAARSRHSRSVPLTAERDLIGSC